MCKYAYKIFLLIVMHFLSNPEEQKISKERGLPHQARHLLHKLQRHSTSTHMGHAVKRYKKIRPLKLKSFNIMKEEQHNPVLIAYRTLRELKQKLNHKYNTTIKVGWFKSC